MSYSAHRRDALDPGLPLAHRASHARSCAVHVAQKYKVHRSAIIGLILRACGVNLMAVRSEQEIVDAIGALDSLRIHGLASRPNGGSIGQHGKAFIDQEVMEDARLLCIGGEVHRPKGATIYQGAKRHRPASTGQKRCLGSKREARRDDESSPFESGLTDQNSASIFKTTCNS
jgi:hypothetical protein